ncbi:prealbumin-like fold domain-containing protein [Erysipelothrix sp. D19-032]
MAQAEGNLTNTVVKHVNYQGSVSFTKENVNGDVLEGAVYKLYDSNNKQIGDTYTTDINGLISVENLAPGIYEFIEVSAPHGYLINTVPKNLYHCFKRLIHPSLSQLTISITKVLLHSQKKIKMATS